MTNHSVGVLLSTYNGEKYLEEQIKSVLNQKGIDVTLYIRDDGSTDGTVSILKKYNENPRCIIYFEKNVGVSKSFFELLQKSAQHEYYAFCDQDDVWKKDKLIVAIKSLLSYSDIPAMYYSKTTPVDCTLTPLKNVKGSFGEEGVFNLRQIMLRNNAIGCTMVFNSILKQFIVQKVPRRVIMHDHWVYALCLALGGNVYYDIKSYILYRQHGNNVVGHKMSVKSKLKHSSLGDNKGIRCEMANHLLKHYSKYIQNENIQIISEYAYYKKSIKRKWRLIVNGTEYALGIKNRVLFILEVLFGFY